MKITTSYPVIVKPKGQKGKVIAKSTLASAEGDFSNFYDGDEFSYASSTPKDPNKPGLLKRIGKGIGKGVKGVGHGIASVGKFIWKGIKNAEQFVVKESKQLATHVKEGHEKRKAKRAAKKLTHVKDKKTGEESFKKEIPPAKENSDGSFTKTNEDGSTKSIPATAVQEVAPGVHVAKEDIDTSKPVTVSKDPDTGKTSIGTDYNAKDVTALKDPQTGNYQYFHDKDLEPEGLSTTAKIAITAGAVLVIGVLVTVIVVVSKRKARA